MHPGKFLIKYLAISCLVSIVLVSFTYGTRSGNNTFLTIAVQLFVLSGLIFNHIKENFNNITDQHMYKLTLGICAISLLFIPAFSRHISFANLLSHIVSISAINAVAVFVITFFSIKIIENTPPDQES